MHRSKLISDIAKDLAAFKRTLMASYARKSGERAPTPAQVGILALLAHGGPQHLKDLAERLCMTSSAATQLVDGLVEARLLTRTEDPSDRRRITLAITSGGRRRLAAAKKAHMAAFTRMLAPLSEGELREWKRLQRKIIDNAA